MCWVHCLDYRLANWRIEPMNLHLLHILLAVAAASIISPAAAQLPTTATVAVSATSMAQGTSRPLDSRHRIGPAEFVRAGKNAWRTGWQKAAFPFDELIYYWDWRPERDQGMRLYVQVRFAPGDESPWLFAGHWGKVKPTTSTEDRTKPRFDRGMLDYDQLLLTARATSYRFRVDSEGPRPVRELPLVGVITTDNNATPELTAKYADRATSPPGTGLLDVPLRKQEDVSGNKLPDRCQSAALAAAMQYFGTTIPLEQIIAFTTDPEYKSFGIWPRTLNAAHEFGFEAYLDRFRDWDAVRRTVAQNKVILCSITMPRNDSYIDPPYKSIGGHIVALCGITGDGRVIVTDSAERGGYLLQWKREDFEKIWMRNKGGVGMVIVPPAGAVQRLVSVVPPFPDYKAIRAAREAAETTATKTP